MNVEEVKDRHKKKLATDVKNEVTNMFENILNFVQIAVDKPGYSRLRPKILRLGNDCIRNLTADIVNNFKVEYITKSEDFIEFNRKGK